MALSHRHRTSLLTTLTPLVGEEEAEALLAEFPSNDLDTPATKDFVRAEGAIMRAEFQTEMGALRTEMVDGLTAVRTEMVDGSAGLRGEMRDGFAGQRQQLLELELRISEKLRVQMVWLVGIMLAAVGMVAMVS